MKKRILSLFLMLALVLSFFEFVTPKATAATYSGTCGTNVTWVLDTSVGVLTISGRGSMKDYSSTTAPWYRYRSYIQCVNIGTGVTSVGDFSFYSCEQIKSISIESTAASIGEYAFCSCKGLISVNIPDGVTSIERMAFNNCVSLTFVNIPDSVTSIGRHAFSYCSSLSSVNIPDSVTDIGERAFSYCSSLTSVNIPDCVTSIEYNAFEGCSSLTSVNIPDSVTSIGEYAFSECVSLTAINIPDSVTSIGSSAFYKCSSLTTVIIPKSVMSIGWWAFCACDNMTSVMILNPTCSINSHRYTLGDPETTVIYGYEKSTAQTYANRYDYDFIAFGNAVSTVQRPVFKANWMLCAVDQETKESIEGAEIALYDAEKATTLTTDRDGVAEGQSELRSAITVVSKEGYRNIITSEEAASQNVSCFLMEKGEADDFYIASARMNFSFDAIKDVRNEQVVIDVAELYQYSKSIHNLTAYINTNGKEVAAVYLKQGVLGYEATLSQESGFTYATLHMPEIYEQLVPGQALYLYAVATDGTVSVAYKLNIKVIKSNPTAQETEMFQTDEKGNIVSFKLGQKMSLKIPDNVPVFGGTELSFLNMDWCPVKTEVDADGTQTIAIGIVDIEGNEDGDAVHKQFNMDEWVDSFKSSAKAYSTADKVIERMKFQSEVKMKSICTYSQEYTVKNDIKPTLDLYGYIRRNAEGKLIDGGFVFSAKVEYKYQGQTFVGYFPVYYEVGGGFGASFDGTFLKWDDEGFRADFEGKIEAELSGKVGGGVGIAKVFTVGVWGEAKLIYSVDFPDIHSLLKLRGAAGLEVQVLGSTVASTNWLESKNAEIVIYDSEKSTKTKPASQSQLFDNLDHTQTVDPISRDYIEETSPWLGGKAKRTASGATQNITLQNGIYTDAQPLLMQTDDGNIILLWLADNAEREAINRTMLVYSVYDAKMETWSAPQAIADDGCADFYPAVSGNYVVWHKSTMEFTTASTLDEMARNSDIYLSVWNGSGFAPAIAVTTHDGMDTTPTVFADGEKATVAWVRNANNNIFGDDDANAIVLANYENGSLSEETVIAERLNAVTDLTAGKVSDAVTIAYVLEGDNDMNTTDDWELYLYSGGAVKKLTDNSMIDSGPKFSDIDGESKLYWFAGGNVVSTGDLQNTETVLPAEDYALNDQFQIIGNGESACIVWPTVKDSRTINGTYFDNGEWTASTELMRLDANMMYPSCVMLEDGRLMVAYNQANENLDEEGTFIGITADLCVATTQRHADTRVNAVYANEADLLGGGKVTLYADVSNIGTKEVKAFNVSVTEENGTVIYSETVECALGLNESATIQFECDDQGALGKKNWTVSVTAEEELTVTDNKQVITVGAADLDIECVTKSASSSYALVIGEVENLGAETATGITVSLLTSEGVVVDSISLEDMPAGSVTAVSFRLAHSPEDIKNSEMYLRVESKNDAAEGNNEALVVLPYALNAVCSEHTWDSGLVVAEPTCSREGQTIFTCTVCATQKTETTYLEHSYVYTVNKTTHVVGCENCDYSANEEHTYESGKCICGAPEYILDSALTFNMGITVGAEMQVVYTVIANKVASFDNFYLEVSKDTAGGEPVVTTYGFGDGMTELVTLTNATGAVAGYRATYTGINAKEMGDDFSAVLYAVAADGTIHYSNATTSSIKTFLMGKLTDSKSGPELKTLAVDMLNYGAAAQVNFAYDTENLVNADLTDEQKALGTQTLPTAVDNSKQTGDGLALSPAVTVKSKVTLVVTCMYAPADASNVRFVIKDTEGKVLAEMAPSKVIAGRAVQGTYDNVGAKEMRNLITIEVYDGDTLVSKTLTWSIESYVAGMLAKATTTENQRNMVNAMLIYGDSAAKYLALG